MKTKPQFYHELDSIIHESAEKNARCICLFSPCGNAGVSSLTISLASRYKDASPRILVLDLNHKNPMSSDFFSHDGPAEKWQFDTISAQLNVNDDEGIYYLSITELDYKDALHDISVIDDAFARWRVEFDYVIVDLSPLLTNDTSAIPPNVFAHVAELTLLMVATGETTEEQLVMACQKLNELNYKNVNMVVSQVKMPPLGPLLVKKVQSLSFIPFKFKRMMIGFIERQYWLFRPIGD